MASGSHQGQQQQQQKTMCLSNQINETTYTHVMDFIGATLLVLLTKLNWIEQIKYTENVIWLILLICVYLTKTIARSISVI